MSWVEQRKHGCRIQGYTQHGMRTLTRECDDNGAGRGWLSLERGPDVAAMAHKRRRENAHTHTGAEGFL